MILYASGKTCPIEPGAAGRETLAQRIAALPGVTFRAPCGGHGVCRKCTVVTFGEGNAANSAGIASLSPAEKEGLLRKARVPREKWESAVIRYACLCRDFTGIDEVYLPDTESLTGAGVSAETADAHAPSFDPLTEVRTLPLPLPEEWRASPRILAEAAELEKAGESSAYAVLATEFLPPPMNENGTEEDFSRQESALRIVSLEKEKPDPLGLAVDIGTTTVALSVWRMTDGGFLGETVSENPQRRYGADVIARMSYAEEHSSDELRRLILSAVREGVEKILAAHLEKTGESRNPDEIVCAVLAGNSVMEHLFLGLPTDTIARAPFLLRTKLGRSLTAAEVFPEEFASLRFTSPEASLYFAPLAASYVGGDITLGLAHLLTSREELSREDNTNALFLDLGTNGELCVIAGEADRRPDVPRFLFAATAAGPALEGAQISMGMSALPGAVSHVRVNAESGSFDCRVIGAESGAEPTGICGSGVISAVAAALDVGLITSYGRICDDGEPEDEEYAGIYEAFEHALGENEDGRLTIAFTGDVKLTDSDVRQVQTAKAAVAAGTRVLLDTSGIGEEALNRVYLAGSFGGGIDVNAAERIGLLPKEAGGKVLSVGNTSAAGAVSQLFRRDFRENLRRVMETYRYIELSCDPAFTEAFVDGMLFGAEEA